MSKRAGKIAQQARALVLKLDDLSSIHGTHAVEGENQVLLVVL